MKSAPPEPAMPELTSVARLLMLQVIGFTAWAKLCCVGGGFSERRRAVVSFRKGLLLPHIAVG